MKTPKTITLYSRAMCGWCMDAKAWLDKMGWPYTVHDIGKDHVAHQKAIELSGQPLVPVIEVDGLVLGDFDINQLETFLRQHGYLV